MGFFSSLVLELACFDKDGIEEFSLLLGGIDEGDNDDAAVSHRSATLPLVFDLIGLIVDGPSFVGSNVVSLVLSCCSFILFFLKLIKPTVL